MYQENQISYCVNYKGQKIKPYKSNYTPTKRQNWLQRALKFIFG